MARFTMPSMTLSLAGDVALDAEREEVAARCAGRADCIEMMSRTTGKSRSRMMVLEDSSIVRQSCALGNSSASSAVRRLLVDGLHVDGSAEDADLRAGGHAGGGIDDAKRAAFGHVHDAAAGDGLQSGDISIGRIDGRGAGAGVVNGEAAEAHVVAGSRTDEQLVVRAECHHLMKSIADVNRLGGGQRGARGI